VCIPGAQASRGDAACGGQSALRGGDCCADATESRMAPDRRLRRRLRLYLCLPGFLTLVGVLGRMVGALPTGFARTWMWTVWASPDVAMAAGDDAGRGGRRDVMSCRAHGQGS
jgi:hypothetical protein